MTEAPPKILNIINGWKIIRFLPKQQCECICPSCEQTITRTTKALSKAKACIECHWKKQVGAKRDLKQRMSREVAYTKEGKAEKESDLLPALKRPTRRSECASLPRPCPFVSCRFNTFLEVTLAGTVQFATRHQDVEEMPAHLSCVLDIADNGEHTLEQVGDLFALTRERIRQVEGKAFRKIKKLIERHPKYQEMIGFLVGSGRNIERDWAPGWTGEGRETQTAIHAKPLTWDEWRNKFTPQETHAVTVQQHTQLLRRWMQSTDQDQPLNVREALAPSEPPHTAPGLRQVGDTEEREESRAHPARGERTPRSLPESPRRSADEREQLNVQRDQAGPVGLVYPLQDDDAGALGRVPLVSQADDAGEPARLPGDGDALDSSGTALRGRVSSDTRPVRVFRRPSHHPLLSSNYARLTYALTSYTDTQLDRLVEELARGPYNHALQDTLRRRLARHLFAGENTQAQRAQRALGILCQHQRKETTMKKEDAQKLLDLLAARPDKADLIEALAKSAGLLAQTAPAQDPEPNESAAEEKKAPLPPRKKNQGGRPKAEAVEDGKRSLTKQESAKIKELVAGGWTRANIARAIGISVSGFNGVLYKGCRIDGSIADRLMGLSLQQEAAE